MLIPVDVTSLAVEPQKSTPLAVLREPGGGRSVAIPLEHAEAGIIAMHWLQERAEKPFTVDLVKIVMEQLGGVLYRAVITDVEDGNSFSAGVVIQAGQSLKVVDCRPGDAVVLAVRCGAPVFVREAVFSKLSSDSGLSAEEQLRERIRSIDTTEFGRYVLE